MAHSAAEVQHVTAPDVSKRLVHSKSGSETQSSSWWAQSSWFAAAPPAACPNSWPREAAPDAAPLMGSQPAQSRAAGGAMAQCRFAGRCAVPIATTAPVDGSPLPRSAVAAWQPRGETCDGTPARASGSVSGGLMSKWRFDMKAWTWVPRDDGGGAAYSAKHMLAARRWGDGCNELPAAARRAWHSTTSCSQQQTQAVTAAGTVAIAAAPSQGFASVGGLWKQKETLHNVVVLPLRHPTLFRSLGVQALRGVLLHGPPGTGKTFLIPALAAEAHAHLEVLNGAEVAAGEQAAARLRQAFTRAKANAPSVLFIDSLEALAPARHPGASAEEQSGAQSLVSLLDGLWAAAGGGGAQVAVVASTNSRSAVCTSLLRPGRLGVEVPFGTPSSGERKEIVANLTAAMPLLGVDAELLAERMRGFVPADCAAVCTEAAIACVSEAAAAAEADVAAERLTPEAAEAQLLSTQLRLTAQHFAAALERVSPSSLRHLMPDVPRVAWSDIGGYEDVKQQLRELIQVPLTRPGLLDKFGAVPSRGALLHGPPGCGKTLLAAATAAECGVNFISVRGPELLDKWLGESERAVRELFQSARSAAPCIIFFDEMDSLAAKRGGGTAATGGDAAAARVLTQLLTEMDGFAASSRVFVLGATNRPDAMDPALLRPGRLDALLEVPLPDEAARAAILAARLRAAPLAPGLDLRTLAALTGGMSGADLTEVCRRACQLAMREYIDAEDEQMGAVPVVAARHLEDALASARRSVLPPVLPVYPESQPEQRQPNCRSSAGEPQVGGEGGACADSMAVGAAGAAGTAAAATSRNRMEAQQAFVKAAAAQAAGAIRAQFGGGNGAGRDAQLAAYVVRLEAALRSAGIPLPLQAS